MGKNRPLRRVAATELTVADAANLFLDHVYQRAHAGQVGWGYYHSCQARLRRVCDTLGPAVEIREVGKSELTRAVLEFARRPVAWRRMYQKSPAERPVAVPTAKGYIQMTKALFGWLSEHDIIEWDRPKGFDRLFRLKDRRLKTAEEQSREVAAFASGAVATFRADELSRLFRSGRSRDRLYILLGLNCGFTSGELSSVRTFEVFLEAERPFIHKRRAKTGVEAKWLLWPETAALLRRHLAPSNPEHRWLLTTCGNPLVEVDEWCRRDAVDQAWSALCTRARPPRLLGHRFLRKTGADAVKRLGGLEESEMYLAHQEPGMNKHYANRNWQRMWDCLDRYRAELPFLGPAWDHTTCSI